MELLGAGGLMADAEAVLLMSACLSALQLPDAQIVLGEAALTYSLLSTFDQKVRDRIRHHLATLDRVALEETARQLPSEHQQLALQLMDLRGEPSDVFSKLASLSLSEAQTQRVQRLKSLVDLLRLERSQGVAVPSVVLDLSLIRPFDYYTGIVFEVVSAKRRQRLGQGGRYDDLLSSFAAGSDHSADAMRSIPGVGFVLNIEELHLELLGSQHLPKNTPSSDWLIVPQSESAAAAALAYAQKARDSEHTVRVELSLDLSRSAEDVRKIARDRNIQKIAWISDQGLSDIEIVNPA